MNCDFKMVRSRYPLASTVLVGLVIAFYLLMSYSPNLSYDYEPEDGGLITATSLGRLGNNMMEFAALLAISKTSKCRPVLTSTMADYLKSCFLVSIPVNTKLGELVPWRSVYLDYLMQDKYRNLRCSKGASTYIKLTGYPSDWRYFEDYQDELRKQLQFSFSARKAVDNFFKSIREDSKNTSTFIGIHVRRTDYIPYLERQSCHIADESYLRKAVQIMMDKYPDAVFVVASDDIPWCETVLNNLGSTTFFVNKLLSPCTTMAILANCNHTIMTQGTFGFWAAYLAGGETIYYSDYCNNDTSILRKFQGNHLPNWTAISAISLQ